MLFLELAGMLFIVSLTRSWPVSNRKCNDGSNQGHIQRDVLDFEVLACGKEGSINMIEVASHEVSEEDIAAVLAASTHVHQQLEQWQKEIVAKIGKESDQPL